jgi:hypothetical protein
MAFQISLNDTKSEFNLEYEEGIELKGPYEVCLKSFVTYNNIPNITNKNNVILYKSGISEHKVVVPVGTYELEDLSRFLIPTSPSNDCGLRVFLNKAKLKVEIFCKWDIDFTTPKSLGPTLGFSKRYLKSYETHHSDLPVAIFTVNTIKIKCNLIKCNIENLKTKDNTLHEFPLSVDPGEKIVERPSSLCYYPVSTDTIYQLHIRVTDQDNNLIDFRGEKVSLTLGFRPV